MWLKRMRRDLRRKQNAGREADRTEAGGTQAPADKKGGARMRKAILALAMAASIALVGCGQSGAEHVQGGVSEVVEGCQGLRGDGEATATVTGDIFTAGMGGRYVPKAGEDMAVALYDSDAQCVVLCKFEDITQEEAERALDGGEVTVTGTVDASVTEEDSVTLVDCEFV